MGHFCNHHHKTKTMALLFQFQWTQVRWGRSSELVFQDMVIRLNFATAWCTLPVTSVKLAALGQGVARPKRFAVNALPSSLAVTNGGMGTMVRMLSCCHNQDNQAYIGTKKGLPANWHNKPSSSIRREKASCLLCTNALQSQAK